METQTSNLIKYYWNGEAEFLLEDNTPSLYENNDFGSFYIYALSQDEAKHFLSKMFADCYKITLKNIQLDDEGVLDFDDIDTFETKYSLVPNPKYSESFFYDKWDDWNYVLEVENTSPGTVWSIYDSEEVVCGFHTVDVYGFYITKTPGEKGETYGHFRGEVRQA
jgi:hypothetical protein